MGKIHIKPDCGNAPRKKFLAALNTAFVKGDKTFLVNNIPDDIIWEKIATKKIDGKEAFTTEITEGPNWKAKEVTIDTIITHGSDASVSGQITAIDNSKFSFCDIYKFKGAAGTSIKEITFIIKLKNKSH